MTAEMKAVLKTVAFFVLIAGAWALAYWMPVAFLILLALMLLANLVYLIYNTFLDWEKN